jgi:hypothetical protein
MAFLQSQNYSAQKAKLIVAEFKKQYAMHMYEKSVEDMQVTLNKLYQAVGDDI